MLNKPRKQTGIERATAAGKRANVVPVSVMNVPAPVQPPAQSPVADDPALSVNVPDAQPVPVAPSLPIDPAASVPRAGIVRGGGLFLRPAWLTYGARHGLNGLGMSNCVLVNRYTGARMPWTPDAWHLITQPEAEWWADCSPQPVAPNTFEPASPPAPVPVDATAPRATPTMPRVHADPAPVPVDATAPRATPTMPRVHADPAPSAPPTASPRVVGGSVYGETGFTPQDWGGGTEQEFPAQAQPQGAFPWWLLALAAASMVA